MHGRPALPAGFAAFPYVNPQAPRGGRIVLGIQGTFDSLSPAIVRGLAPDAIPRYVLQSLMTRSIDEPFTLYGLVAQSVEAPPDRRSITFRLDPRARFSDGHPLTADDVRFSFEMLKAHGKPFHQGSFAQVSGVEVPDEHTIRFDLSGSDDRELPLIIALMPLFAKHATDPATFAETSLKAPLGSGPYVVSDVRPGEQVTLTRRRDYWAEDLPVTRGLYNFDEIRLDFYRDANTLFEAFKAGLYDFRVEYEPVRWLTGYDVPAVREGRILRESVPNALPKGMNAFVFNSRRSVFADVRVREALGFLFDFGWVNRNLYFGALRRTHSYFEGSDLASTGRPASALERTLLGDAAVRPDILDGTWRAPGADASGRDRATAGRALALLRAAGWVLRSGRLEQETTGEPFGFEILVTSRPQERLALNYAASLARIGIAARVRMVDDVQFWRRISTFDFDMIQWTWPSSLSPGSEQRSRWSSLAAERHGSLNFAGARSPAVDRLVEALLAAEERDEFVAAVRALDRVLLSGFYVVPLFHLPDQWIAYSAGLRRPDRIPLFGPTIDTWWRATP